MSLYFYILFFSVIVPILFTIFCIDFIKEWKSFAISTLAIALAFLVWDLIFTDLKVWGFNKEYCSGISIFGLPIEECLFFLAIPFCSLFTHFAIFHLKPNLKLGKKITRVLAITFLLLAILLVVFNYDKAYTCVNYSTFSIVLLIGLVYRIELLQQFFISFIIILIPFFIVNGILTGAITPLPVVWYDDAENLGIRLVTIPIEDIGYAFTMLFGNLMLFDSLVAIKNKLCILSTIPSK
jgi:lycopene cyclase domain-containing protein